jgi:uncharacterized membrane protein YdjX (TVP38/TMEM64 family)
MTILKKILRDRRFHRLAGVMLVIGAGAGLLAWRMGVDGAMLKGYWKQSEGFLMGHQVLLFVALVILPGLPVPTSALLFLAGTVWRDRPVVACAICLVAIALNMTWTYWLAARPGRGLVEKLIIAGNLRIPEVDPGNHLRLLLLLRLTPGFPLFLQNYLLGFFRVPFRLYLWVSMCCTGLITCGVVLSAGGVAGGNLTPVITGVGLIVLGWVVVQWVKAKMLKGKS